MHSTQHICSALYQVWDSDTGSRIDFSPITPTNKLEDDTPAIAYVIENDVMLQAVTEKNQTLLNLETRRGVRVERVFKPSVNEEWITVSLEDGQAISSRLLVCALEQVLRLIFGSIHCWHTYAQVEHCFLSR